MSCPYPGCTAEIEGPKERYCVSCHRAITFCSACNEANRITANYCRSCGKVIVPGDRTKGQRTRDSINTIDYVWTHNFEGNNAELPRNMNAIPSPVLAQDLAIFYNRRKNAFQARRLHDWAGGLAWEAMLEGNPPGYLSSPLLVGSFLYIVTGHTQQIFRLHLETGEMIPCLIEADGKVADTLPDEPFESSPPVILPAQTHGIGVTALLICSGGFVFLELGDRFVDQPARIRCRHYPVRGFRDEQWGKPVTNGSDCLVTSRYRGTFMYADIRNSAFRPPITRVRNTEVNPVSLQSIPAIYRIGEDACGYAWLAYDAEGESGQSARSWMILYDPATDKQTDREFKVDPTAIDPANRGRHELALQASEPYLVTCGGEGTNKGINVVRIDSQGQILTCDFLRNQDVSDSLSCTFIALETMLFAHDNQPVLMNPRGEEGLRSFRIAGYAGAAHSLPAAYPVCAANGLLIQTHHSLSHYLYPWNERYQHGNDR